MPKEVILNQLHLSAKEGNGELRLVMNCAPVLKKVKAACILTVTHKKFEEAVYHLGASGISYRILYSDERIKVVLFYHEDMLRDHLNKKRERTYLRKYGYDQMSFEGYLDRLCMRMSAYHRREADFPHELGIFLEYPIEDVESFILNGGKNFLLSGYWKVYSNPEQARKIFAALDEAKNTAIDEWFAGKQIYEIAG